MYHLIDTFNSRLLSSHRTLAAVVKADRKFERDVKRNNGASSYIPVEYRKGGSRKTWRTKSQPVTYDDMVLARVI